MRILFVVILLLMAASCRHEQHLGMNPPKSILDTQNSVQNGQR